MKEYEVTSGTRVAQVLVSQDGRSVWVNDHQGCCIGRWSAQGMDVHKTGDEQMSTGLQCLFCDEGPYELFQEKMFEFHEIKLRDL